MLTFTPTAVRLRAQSRYPGRSINSQHIHICSANNFPTAAGLASSAAGYACLGMTRCVFCVLLSLFNTCFIHTHLFLSLISVFALAQALGVADTELTAIARLRTHSLLNVNELMKFNAALSRTAWALAVPVEVCTAALFAGLAESAVTVPTPSRPKCGFSTRAQLYFLLSILW